MKNIYKITNCINDKIYIGKTTRPIQDRFEEHIQEAKRYNRCLRNGKSFPYQSKLYQAMVKYGYNNFIITLVESCDESYDIDEKERYYIELYKSNTDDIGYNICKGGAGGPSQLGRHHTAEMKKRHSEMQKGKKWYNNGTDEIMIYKTHIVPDGFVPGRIYKGLCGEKNPAFGKPGINKGKHLSEETKKKLSETKKRNNALKNKIWITDGKSEFQIDLNCQEIPDGFYKGRFYKSFANSRSIIMYDLEYNQLKEFPSLSAAGRATGISAASILACCSGRTKKAGQFRWKYKNVESNKE